MSVVGFDIGNENCVIAATKNRGIDVLLNDESKRETPAVVSFGEKQRFLGSAGAASASMNPRSTISQVKRLLGVKFKECQDNLRLLPFETSEGPDGGILIHLQYLNEKQTYTPIQIMAMLLAHLKQMTEKNLETSISDCVIGIPSYFTDLQRRAYLHAAHIAGLKPLRLLHDCTATALGFGIYKTDYSNSGPTNVVFVDIGHCDTQVAIAAFQPGHMKILSHSFDQNLGGRDFDEVLFRYFAEQFKEKYNIDVYSNTRASVRLRASCEKLKKVLSANAEAPLNIECLMEEKDVKGFIKREEFEKLSSELLERLSIPCRKAVADAGLNVDKIHSIELVGSGSRIPAITKILASLFGREPRRTLNASECVARGCAFQCAMLSPIFRVREYEVQDRFPFSIGLSSDEGEIMLSNGVLFPKGHPFPSVKIVTVHRSSTFHMELFYANQNELPPGLSQKISNITIGPFKTSHTERGKVKVRVQLNLHGIVTIESATLLEDDYSQRNNVHSNSDTTPAVASDSDDTPADEMRNSKVHRQNIPVHESVCGDITRDDLSQAKEIEDLLARQDIKMEETKDRRNTLEAFVYDTRNKLLNTYRSFATETEREGISKNLQDTEDWLYEEGDDESELVYTEKLEDLKRLVDPIENRYKDKEARVLEARALMHCVEENRVAARSLPSAKREAINNECVKAEQWIWEKMQQQDSLPKNVDPVLWSSEIKQKTEAFDVTCKHIMGMKSSLARHEDMMDVDQKSEHDDSGAN